GTDCTPRTRAPAPAATNAGRSNPGGEVARSSTSKGEPQARARVGRQHRTKAVITAQEQPVRAHRDHDREPLTERDRAAQPGACPRGEAPEASARVQVLISQT